MRAVHAAIVMPVLFWFTDEVVGNVQLAMFASFGAFATLVLVNFAGSWQEKLVAHLGLAVAGSVLVVVGTTVTASNALAAVVTIPVAFAAFFAGTAGPNAALAVTGVLLAFVLPAASPGTTAMIPERLTGWCLASAVATLAVLVLPTPSGGDRLRAAAARLAAALADAIDAGRAGATTDERLGACIEAKHDLLAIFNATPFQPTGLTGPDQALANVIELLEWCTSLAVDADHLGARVEDASDPDRELLATAASVLRDAAALLTGSTRRPHLARLDARRRESIDRILALTPAQADFRTRSRRAFHAHAIAVTVLAIGANAEVAERLVGADEILRAGARWFGTEVPAPGRGRRVAVSRYAGVAFRHASLRSVWFINSARRSLALAAAVAVAGYSDVQHGFWVVLGTLSVLRTNAASTGATALRAIAGTVAGFAVGGVLVEVIGTHTAALWVMLPIAILIAAYAPSAAPFAVGQAAFTVFDVVLCNLLLPVGWRVGAVRLQDVTLGCLVSVVVGLLFWPRGAAPLVGDDLADAFRSGAAYLSHAVDHACGVVDDIPGGATAAVAADARLDAALRAFLAERGSKRISKIDLWRLVGGTMRLHLTAHAVAGLPRDDSEASTGARAELRRRTQALRGFYEDLAEQLGPPRGRPVRPLSLTTPDARRPPRDDDSHITIWLGEDLGNLAGHLPDLLCPATAIAELRRRPWWR